MLAGEVLPHAQPQEVGRGEGDEHRVQPVGIARPDAQQLEGAQADGVPHVDVRPSQAVEQVRVERGHGHEGTPDAENLHHRCAGQPLVRDSNDNQLLRHEPQAEHGGQADKYRETQHLVEDVLQACRVVRGFAEDGLTDAVDHP